MLCGHIRTNRKTGVLDPGIDFCVMLSLYDYHQVLAMDTIDVEKITEDQVKKFVKQGTIPKKSDIHKNLAAIIEIRERVNAYSK